jgi:hypothetical protein
MTPARRRSPAADQQETRTPDERQIDRFVRSSSYQLITPILITILMAVGGWWFSAVGAKLDRIDGLLAKTDKDNALIDQRVKVLEASKVARDSELGVIHNDIQDLKIQLATGRNGAKP